MPPLPELSILVPTLAYPAVDRVLSALAAQTAEPESYEVVVSDCMAGRWRRAVTEIGAARPRFAVKYVQCDRGPLARARALNHALEAATGRLIAFLAGDFTPDRDFASHHRRFHALHPEENIAAIGPARFVPSQASSPFVGWLEQGDRLFGYVESTGDLQGFFYSGNSSLKRAFLDRAGRMDEDFPYDAIDDHEFGIRLRSLGLVSRHLPEALVWHEHTDTPDLAERIAVMCRAGESAAILEQKIAGPHSWEATRRRSRLRYAFDAAYWRVIAALRRDDAAMGHYYAARLESAFARGWRARQRRDS